MSRDDYLMGRLERPLEGVPDALAATIEDLNARGERERALIAASLAGEGGGASHADGRAQAAEGAR
jgi:hypothetical protein